MKAQKKMDRSRSTPEKGTVDAASHRIIAQGTSISESSSSEGRGQNVQRASQMVPTNQTGQSPDETLSQFVRGSSEQPPISLPSNPSAQFRARADEVRGESLQFKRGELIKFRKRGGQKLLSKHVQRVKKNCSGSRKFFCSHQSEKNRKLRVHSDP